MLLETKDRSNVDGNASFVEESAALSELRADLMNSVEEPRLEKLNFVFRIPKIGCLLSALRQFTDKTHGASIGDANSSFSSWRVHLIMSFM